MTPLSVTEGGLNQLKPLKSMTGLPSYGFNSLDVDKLPSAIAVADSFSFVLIEDCTLGYGLGAGNSLYMSDKISNPFGIRSSISRFLLEIFFLFFIFFLKMILLVI